jgi:hypothetical protein
MRELGAISDALAFPLAAGAIAPLRTISPASSRRKQRPLS